LFVFIALFNSVFCVAQQQQDEVESKLTKPTIFETLTNNVDSKEGMVILTQMTALNNWYKKEGKSSECKIACNYKWF
jgi:hypothetical protein